MISTFGKIRVRKFSALTSLVVAAALGGCAGLGDSAVSGAFVDPARYAHFDCQQLEAERARLASRTNELQALINKARTGAAGAVVGAVAYESELVTTRAAANLVEQEWARGRCVASAPQVVAPTAPGRKGR